MKTRSLREEIIAESHATEQLRLTDQVVSTYDLEGWAERFSLMTAGYRDHIDPNDAGNPEVPINVVTVAIMAAAKARVLLSQLPRGSRADVHIGGEVRAHTRKFIQVAARVYAAVGFRVHLRPELGTCPIWYSSFGVLYQGYQSGDNFTASHSPYFKQGWKVLDREGKEMTTEEEEIIAAVRSLVASRATIELAPWDSSAILFDFDVDQAYASYQRSALGAEVVATIIAAAGKGLRSAACPSGGSMGDASRRILRQLGIPAQALTFFLDEEDPRFHRIGEIGGHNYGADIGKADVCANTGAPEKLLSGAAHVVLLWDPDGDRFSIMTTAPLGFRERALEFGLKVGPDNGKHMVVYLIPNQLYLLILHYRIKLLRASGLIEPYDWFLGTTFPSSMAIEELSDQEGLPTIRVPVGFRYLGDLCREIEENLGQEQVFTMVTGQKVALGPKPRPILLCEESGGAAMGGPDLLSSKDGRLRLLALREKDGLQLSLLAWAVAASLHESGLSMAEQYCNIITERNIQYRYSARFDVSLYDESLTGSKLRQAKAEGISRRDQIVAFFRNLTTLPAPTVDQRLGEANPAAAKEAITRVQMTGWIGDGSLFALDGARLIVRASGTDALIRYYVETTSRKRLEAMRAFVTGMKL